MNKEAFEKRIEEIRALRSAPVEDAEPQLRRALKERSNYLAAKAATVTGDRELESLTPDLLAAFDRFMTNAAKSDPQCWAKNAIAKALRDVHHTDPEVFLRGMRHVQPEPVWGGSKDTAATLRGTCAIALTGCEIDGLEALTALTDALADKETPVRIDAARAIAQLTVRAGLLPLRLKVLVGDREPEVVGECMASLLSIAPEEYVPFVGEFLHGENEDLRLEAAGALAESREPAAMALLEEFWQRQTDPQAKRDVIRLIAGSPLPAAADFLVSVVETASDAVAGEAIVALSKSRYRGQVKARVAAIVAGKGSEGLRREFEGAFGGD